MTPQQAEFELVKEMANGMNDLRREVIRFLRMNVAPPTIIDWLETDIRHTEADIALRQAFSNTNKQ